MGMNEHLTISVWWYGLEAHTTLEVHATLEGPSHQCEACWGRLRTDVSGFGFTAGQAQNL